MASISRRTFLRALPGLAYALQASTASAARLEHTLRITDDSKIQTYAFTPLIPFDPGRAEKAIKLAKYVIEKESVPLKYDSHLSYNACQIVQVEIPVADFIYNVTVFNWNKQTAKSRYDELNIKFRPKGSTIKENTEIRDRGLDGRCDYGDFGASFKGVRKGEPNTRDFDINPGGNSFGHEHREKFQRLYEKSLNTLIKAYETRR